MDHQTLPTKLELHPEYAQRACADTNPNVFFPDTKIGEVVAKNICNRCVIRGQCLDIAIANKESLGVLGGKTEKERRVIQRRNHRNSIRVQ